jgi:hypothetical protein
MLASLTTHSTLYPEQTAGISFSEVDDCVDAVLGVGEEQIVRGPLPSLRRDAHGLRY